MSLSASDQAIRSTGIGASEAAKIVVGEGAIDIYLRLRHPDLAEKVNSIAAREGQLLEPMIADLYAERTGYVLRTCGSKRHPDVSFVLATLDRLAVDPETGDTHAVEIKRPKMNSRHMWGDQHADDTSAEVPRRYLIQCAIQMAVADVEWCDLVALIEGDETPMVFTLHRDRELEQLVIGKLVQWWTEHIVHDSMPAPDGSDATENYLKRRYPKHGKNLLPADDDSRALVRELAKLKTWCKQAVAHQKEITNILKARIGEASGIEGLCTWRLPKSAVEADRELEQLDGEGGRVAWKALADHLGATREQIAAFTAAPSRTFRLARNLEG